MVDERHQRWMRVVTAPDDRMRVHRSGIDDRDTPHVVGLRPPISGCRTDEGGQFGRPCQLFQQDIVTEIRTDRVDPDAECGAELAVVGTPIGVRSQAGHPDSVSTQICRRQAGGIGQRVFRAEEQLMTFIDDPCRVNRCGQPTRGADDAKGGVEATLQDGGHGGFGARAGEGDDVEFDIGTHLVEGAQRSCRSYPGVEYIDSKSSVPLPH